MKKAALKISLVLLFVLQFAIFSCTEDNPVPETTDPRDNFTGVWIVNEQWTKLTYEVNITKDAGTDDGIYLENFAASGAGVRAHALVSGNDVDISPLPQTLSNGWVIQSGSGALSGTTKINWNYIFDDEANTYNATATYTKK